MDTLSHALYGKGLFGYNGDPSLIELLSWFLCVCGLGFLWKKAS